MKELAMRLVLMLVAVSFIGGCVQMDGSGMKRGGSSSDAVASQFGKKKPDTHQKMGSSPSAAMTGSAATPTISLAQPLLGMCSLQA